MNAKELTLSKLNAGTKMIGMYIYGITIGMDFKDIARILMSDVGGVINSILNDDVFSGRQGFNRVNDSLFKYFDEGPGRMLLKYNVYLDSNGNRIPSPLSVLSKIFIDEVKLTDRNGKPLKFKQALALWSRNSYHLSEKLAIFEYARNKYNSTSLEGKEIFNLLIDAVEDYILQNHIISQNTEIYEDIRTLANGGLEMYVLGRILSLNQGIKTKPEELVSQINLIERAIYNQTKDLDDLIDLTKFATDEQYRSEQIAKYEKVKHSFNVLDVATKTPHFMGYIQTLAIAAKEALCSFKFRSSKALSLRLASELNIFDESKITKGIQNFIGDYLRKSWMRSREISFVIPKGNKAFDRNGNMYELQEDTLIKLGTDWGDATYRMWFENEIIPNLKKGILKPGGYSAELVNSKFISDLGNDLLTTTVSKNPSIVYTLPINMMPRDNAERAIFNRYKSSFIDISKLPYTYNISTLNLETGIYETRLSTPTSILDLFTYYAMIADSWKLGEKSLVPILEDFLNSGQIQDFHNFEAIIDKSSAILNYDNIDLEDLYPYIAPFESPFSSFSKYIWNRNKNTRKMLLMKKTAGLDFEDSIDAEYLPTTINGYEFRDNEIDTNYFTTGHVESPIKEYNLNITIDGKLSNITITYDKDSELIITLNQDGLEKKIKKLNKVPITKVNGYKNVNKYLLSLQIKEELDPTENCN